MGKGETVAEFNPLAAMGKGVLENGKLNDIDFSGAQPDPEQPHRLELFDPGHEVVITYDEWEWA